MAKSTARQPVISSRRTAMQFVVPFTEFVKGEGTKTTYKKIAVSVSCGGDVTTDIFYGEWQNNFGILGIRLEQQAVPNPARIRMVYVKEVYEALKNKLVRIYKNANENEVYVLNSSVDNVLNENKILEFNVKQNVVV